MHFVVLVAAAMSLVALDASRAATSLDGFLAGVDMACAANRDFKAFSESLNARYNESGNRAAPLAMSKEMAALLGTIHTEKKDEYVEVSGLQFAFGIENGIYVYSIVFNEPAAKVHKVFDKAIAAGNKKLKREVEAGAATGIKAENGETQLYCDWSN